MASGSCTARSERPLPTVEVPLPQVEVPLPQVEVPLLQVERRGKRRGRVTVQNGWSLSTVVSRSEHQRCAACSAFCAYFEQSYLYRLAEGGWRVRNAGLELRRGARALQGTGNPQQRRQCWPWPPCLGKGEAQAVHTQPPPLAHAPCPMCPLYFLLFVRVYAWRVWPQIGAVPLTVGP